MVPMIQQAVMTDFRPIFILMLAILIVFFVLSLIGGGRNSGIPFSTVLSVSISHLLIAAVLFYTESQLVESLEATPDSITLYLFIGILILTIVNPLIYKLRNRNASSSRYRYRR